MKRFLTIAFLVTAALGLQAKTYTLKSPDKNIVITVADGKQLSWSVERGGETVLFPSAISMEVAGHGVMGINASARKAVRRNIDKTITAVVPVKFRTVRDRCNQLTLEFKGWSVVFRAYDNGVAYRFETALPGKMEVNAENSQWAFAPECEVYWADEKNQALTSHCEANFVRESLGDAGRDGTYCFLPMSLLTPSGTRAVVTEADLFDYPNMLLRSGNGCIEAFHPHVIDAYDMRTDRDVTITSLAPCIARTEGTRTFPWRVITLGDDRSLLENTLPWQLSSSEVPCDWSWLRPGKISWEWWNGLNLFGVDFKAGVNTETYKYYIDFAAAYGLEYILLDEGWSASTLNIVECKPDLDLQQLIDYGKSKGVGVVLWTLWTPMMADMEHILDVYRQWGVGGIKIDFMQMLDQNMVNFYEKIAAECAKRHLLVDYHGAFKPAGLQRKYPNAMNFEGVLGMEMDKCSDWVTPDHDLDLPFTRMVAGPMDYTPGAVNNATKADFAALWSHPMSQGTRSHQAALFIAYEGPLMMLCDSPSKYYSAPDFTHFLAQVPTVWEETVAQEARAGDYLLLSRRSSDGRWFSAGLTDWTERDFTLDTSFLAEGEWEVLIHRDGLNANSWAEDYKIETLTITAGDPVPVHMACGGGWAAIFTRK